ncbi:SDR family NAD(P)-dependent oxidoreductase [Bacillus thuringiensis]|nr:SDR family NAD(P)-dependent oxidoreductase [Bacillus thuringiensis]
MNIQEILSALQAGEVSSEDAKRRIMALKAAEGLKIQSPADQADSRSPEPEKAGLKVDSRQSAKSDSAGLVVSNVHHISEVSLRPWSVSEPSFGEMTIQVMASAVNFPDIMCVNGLYPTMPDYPFVPGFEVAGIVTRIGKGVEEFRIGDEVIALTGKQLGGHASEVNVAAANAVRKPANITFEDGCSLPVVFSTVYLAFETGKLAPGEQVLIQTATGGCGLIALQLANLKGCKIYGTSSKAEKLDLLDRLGVAAAIDYSASPFDREIASLTNGRGVDVVLNMLAGDAIQKGLNCLAPSGRYLELAVHALKTSGNLDLSGLVHNQTIHSIDLRRLSAQKGFNKELLHVMVDLLQTEKIVPIVSRIYPFQRIQEALEYVSSGQHIGKVVISRMAEDMTDRTDELIERMRRQKSQRQESFELHSAQAAVRSQKDMPKEKSRKTPDLDGIAIIGMSGQFPKAATIDELWDNICKGEDCVSEIPAERWSLERYYDPDPKKPGKTYSKWMGVLEDADKFDPLFFQISPVEAEYMDPQQRLFLANSWACIENAGLRPSDLSGSRCGVFAGCGTGDYGRMERGEELHAQNLMGTSVSILSARISYLLNLKGPCMAIDTACSSSLVAISEACSSLLLDNCDMALAGGVNVMSGPAMHIMTSKSGMLSKDGRCYTFDNRANGFVPGEGTGVLLLKRLSDAVRDKDPVYAVIRGWGINQDGKTNGITAPSAASQEELEKSVFDKFGINPETISLVEAHGTGTKLGDPIEVEALTASFAAYTDKKGYCALGSIKSNIGHLLAASGVSGVIKVVQSLKHRMLPPTIHFDSLNEHIRLDGSPFFVNTSLKKWEIESGIRRASVSSFGFSGTNAYMVIEEYNPESPGHSAPPMDQPLLFPVSAKTEDGLDDAVASLKAFLLRETDICLSDVALTLQAGREEMDVRAAFTANTKEELLQAMEDHLLRRPSSCVFSGKVNRRQIRNAIASGEELPSEHETSSSQAVKLADAAKKWVQGLQALPLVNGGERIHMPTYPFAKERYWLEAKASDRDPLHTKILTERLHPLVHRNTSVLGKTRFSASFTNEETLLRDHVVSGQSIMPGMAYLEMARAAVELATDYVHKGQALTLENVVWLRPFIAKATAGHLHVSLTQEGDNQVSFCILAGPSKADANEGPIYSKGTAVIHAASAPPQLDVQAIRAQCSVAKLDSETCYGAFENMGIAYGPGYRAVKTIEIGEDCAIAKIHLPAALSDETQRIGCNPVLLDAAAQSTIGFALHNHGRQIDACANGPYVPFAIQELTVYRPCTSEMWAVTRIRKAEASGDSLRVFDIDLCDEEGHVCAAMRGLATKSAGKSGAWSFNPHQAETDGSHQLPDGLLLLPTWELAAFNEAPALQHVPDADIVIGGTPEQINQINHRYPAAQPLSFENEASIEDMAQKLSNYNDLKHIIWISPVHPIQTVRDEGIISEQKDGVFQLFRLIKSLLEIGFGSRPLHWSIITVEAQPIRAGETSGFAHAGVHGLVGSMAKEYPNWSVCLLDIGLKDELPLDVLPSLPRDAKGNAWGYRKGDWYKQMLVPVKSLPMERTAYRHGGVYVVIGGAGGIGEVWTEYMIRTYQAQIVWIGRREMDEAIRAKIARLGDLGPAPSYIRADAANLASLQQAYETIKARYMRIHGIVHSAIVLLDQSLAKMDEQRFEAGYAAKNGTAVRTAQVFDREQLDFVLFFSSFNSFLKSRGQSNYTAGCTFSDAFAAKLASEWSCAVKTINWGYWGSVGTVSNEALREKMARIGMGSVEPDEAMDVVERLLAGKVNQLCFVKTTKPLYIEETAADQHITVLPERFGSVISRIRSVFAPAPFQALSSAARPIEEKTGSIPDAKQRAEVLSLVREAVAMLLKVDEQDIEPDAELAEYGLDPVKMSLLTEMINQRLGIDVTPELVIRHRSFRELADRIADIRGKLGVS